MSIFSRKIILWFALGGFLIALCIISLLFFTETKNNVYHLERPEAHHVLGTSHQGRNIDAYTYGSGDTHLLFVGGIHGGYEWNTVLLAYSVIDHLKANPNSIPADVRVTVVPSLNPDGLFVVTNAEGRFGTDGVDQSDTLRKKGRFNAQNVDLNRNFDCKWQSQSTWGTQTVSAGVEPFSEKESLALKEFINVIKPRAVIFWHSKGNAVYASECEEGILPETEALMHVYAQASGYEAFDSFDHYPITGDAEGYLASIGIPALTVELSTHEETDTQQNLAGITALFDHYSTENASP